MHLKSVLFLCVGNSCRSQMAEGFARRYGSDVLKPASAGLHPAAIIQPLTKKVMEEKNIRLDDQFPKGLDSLDVSSFDLVVNMSGVKLPAQASIEVRDWKVQDPIGEPEEVYVAVRDQLEMAVMNLILELRRAANGKDSQGVPRVPGRAAKR
jgi:arsenate reductase (thioredoxin)